MELYCIVLGGVEVGEVALRGITVEGDYIALGDVEVGGLALRGFKG